MAQGKASLKRVPVPALVTGSNMTYRSGRALPSSSRHVSRETVVQQKVANCTM